MEKLLDGAQRREEVIQILSESSSFFGDFH